MPPESPLVKKRRLLVSTGTDTGSIINSTSINVIIDDTPEDKDGDENENCDTNIERNGSEKYFSEIFAYVTDHIAQPPVSFMEFSVSKHAPLSDSPLIFLFQLIFHYHTTPSHNNKSKLVC